MQPFDSSSGSRKETYDYDLVARVPHQGVHECVSQGDWVYTTTLTSLNTIDVSDPQNPRLKGSANAKGNENLDVKVDGDVAGLANNRSPGGVTFFDVSNPEDPKRLSFHDAESHVHNFFIDGDNAYLCINESFTTPKMAVVDILDPENPTKIGEWGLADDHEEMAETRLNPIHDIYVQDGLGYLCFWDGGVVIVDVSEPNRPREIAHFGATEKSSENPLNSTEGFERHLGLPGNAHYVQPTPEGDYTLVGDESFPGKTDSEDDGYGGIRIFDTTSVSTNSPTLDPDERDPSAKKPKAVIPPPIEPKAIIPPTLESKGDLLTSHNFDVTRSKLFASFYEGGIRAYDISDPTSPKLLASFSSKGSSYWTAVNIGASSPPSEYYTAASDIGRSIEILRLGYE
ncbi:MAG: hypothetical protein SV377_04415 [Halobacteria archaeon]|nr:hypothetical protein [Halobacteria archaeon]